MRTPDNSDVEKRLRDLERGMIAIWIFAIIGGIVLIYLIARTSVNPTTVADSSTPPATITEAPAETATNGASSYDLAQKCGGGAFKTILYGGRCQSVIAGYVAGLANAHYSGICFPPSFDARTALPIVQSYMRDHPERLSDSPGTLINEAMQAAYPCT